jgi:glycosyltransferase involved in cell wall biosynthesis
MRNLAGLRICFLAGTLGQGGAERQLFYILRVLKEHGAQPRVLCLTTGEYWEERIEALGIRVTWVGQSSSRLQRLRAIIRDLRREPAVVFQSQHFYTNIYVAAAARLLGLHGIGALRSDGVNDVRANRGLLGLMSLRAPSAIAANSRQAIENAVASGVPRDRLHFLPNVVDTSQFTIGKTRTSSVVRILTVGRCVRAKRFDRFLRVVAAVRQRSAVPVCGVLVGDGAGRTRLEADAVELGLAPESVEFHGLKATVIDFYHDADVFLLTSDWEGTPNVVLEGMACGLPIVATRVGGLPDIVADGEVGYLVCPNDEIGLVNALLELAEDPVKRKTYGARGRLYVEEHHAVTGLAQNLGCLYARILDSRSTEILFPMLEEQASN